MTLDTPRTRDLTGYRFGRLSVIGLADMADGPRWLCICACGQKVRIPSVRLRSCGKGGRIQCEACTLVRRRYGYSVMNQSSSDRLSRQIRDEYLREGVPLRVLAQRHGLSISSVQRRIQRAQKLDRGTR
jgi:hypothetical protein